MIKIYKYLKKLNTSTTNDNLLLLLLLKIWAKEKSIPNLLYSRKNILHTNVENNLFSMKMNFDEDLIGAKRTERRKGSKIKSEEIEEEDGAATAAEEQLKAIPPGCISLLPCTTATGPH